MSIGPEGRPGATGAAGAAGAEGRRGERGERGEPGPIHPVRWTFLAIWVVLFTVMVSIGFRLLANAIHDNAKARTALCVRRDKLRAQVDRSMKYLADVHAGHRKPIPGITEKEILDGIKDNRDELVSLAPLNCPTAQPK